MFDLSFYNGKKVLVTGHTGFKGTWLCTILVQAGAEVTGYALDAPTTPSLFEMTHMEKRMNSIIGDIRDLSHLEKVFSRVQPEIVFHLAAQPIVRESYKNPVYTYETNVMGTVNMLECVRRTASVKSVVNVTTDKVYKNHEWEWGYRENEELNGYDPYSNSKSCSELVTGSYKNAFLDEKRIAVSTVRAGNVLGGGDFAADRIIPDCVRAMRSGREIQVRNPYSVRPYQHVLDPLFVYLMIAQAQYEDYSLAGCYNVGPDEEDCLATGDLVTMFCQTWKKYTRRQVGWRNLHDGGPHEAGLLKLDCSRLKAVFDWRPVWHMEDTMKMIVEWYRAWFNGKDMSQCVDDQITAFLADAKKKIQ